MQKKKNSKHLKPRFSSIRPIHRILIRCYHSRTEWTWEGWQWRGIPDSLKPQHHWNLTIRLFSVIYRTLFVGSLTPLHRSSRCILQSHPTGQSSWETGWIKEDPFIAIISWFTLTWSGSTCQGPIIYSFTILETTLLWANK